MTFGVYRLATLGAISVMIGAPLVARVGLEGNP